MKNQALENRIKRLAYEQQRAQKLTDIATEKAGKLLDARDRHQRQIEAKLKLQEARQIEEEKKRILNAAVRDLAVQKKKINCDNISEMNLKTKQYMINREKEGF